MKIKELFTMRKTISQLRYEEAVKLAGYKSVNPSEKDIDEAISLMTSFYRFCGLDERIFYLENDEKWHDSRCTKECVARRDKWLDRLKKRFAEYGLVLTYCGYLPSIGIESEYGGFSEKITRYFYN